MVAHTFNRGHKIEYKIGDITGYMLVKGHMTEFIVGDGWVYSDTKESTDIERPCKKCGRMPTKEGHDPCISNLPGVQHACCGHGIEQGYAVRGNRHLKF